MPLPTQSGERRPGITERTQPPVGTGQGVLLGRASVIPASARARVRLHRVRSANGGDWPIAVTRNVYSCCLSRQVRATPPAKSPQQGVSSLITLAVSANVPNMSNATSTTSSPGPMRNHLRRPTGQNSPTALS